jgi:hypothetical protein
VTEGVGVQVGVLVEVLVQVGVLVAVPVQVGVRGETVRTRTGRLLVKVGVGVSNDR